jgi:hypothetical protein
MNTLKPKTHRLPFSAEVSLIAVGIALLVTACGWLVADKASPLNHGVSPDVHDSPLVMCWVVANFPAAFLFISLFGKLGAEWEYFLCVFIQWLVVGIGWGALTVAVRRAKKCV